MIEGLKPYPKMKHSGVPWLGDVPSHWEIRKLRQLLHRRTERNRPDLPLLSVVREKGVILRDLSNDENHNFIPDDLSNYKVVRPGQFTMNKMKAWQGSFGVSRHDGIVSPAYFIFDLAGVDGAFFHFAIRSRAYVSEFSRASDGVRISQWDLSESRMREIDFAVPPLQEQDAVVRFLDNLDRQIRRYIRARQKLIKLVEEQKQAIIHRAVTRGLDPDVSLKPSGVEVLGDLPEHWDVTQLRRIVKNGRAITYGIVQPGGYVRDGRPMVRAQDYSFGWAERDTVYHVAPEVEEPYRRSRLDAGDLVYTIVGQGSVGNVAIVPESFSGANITQTTARISVDPVVADPWYVLAVLDGPIGQTQLRRRVKGVGQPGINLGHLRLFQIPLPPVEEQRVIATFLASRSTAVSSAITIARSEIRLLNEYRTRLIADVVTGKLDVREAAARLPDEIDESEPLDEIESEADTEETAEGDTDEVLEEAEA